MKEFHEEMLLVGLLDELCSATFSKQPRVTCLGNGTAPSGMGSSASLRNGTAPSGEGPSSSLIKAVPP